MESSMKTECNFSITPCTPFGIGVMSGRDQRSRAVGVAHVRPAIHQRPMAGGGLAMASPLAAGSSVKKAACTGLLRSYDRISYLVDLTQKSTLVIERELKLAGFWESIPARNKLKAEIQKILLAPEFVKVPNLIKNRAHIISRVMEIAKKNNDIILFAD